MDWPFAEGARLVSQTANLSTSTSSVSLTGTVGAKPATPTEMVASTPWNASGILVHFVTQSTTASVLVDIMAGSSSNEYVLVPDLLSAAITTQNKLGHSYFFPIFVPAGTRLSGRAAVSAACNVVVNISLLQGSFGGSSFTSVTAYGVDVANARGTVLDAGGTPNTKPALPATQITATTSAPIRLMTAAIGAAGDFDRLGTDRRALVDIYAGAASSEYALIDGMPLSTDTTREMWVPVTPVSGLPVYVPKGSRLSARMQATTFDAGDRTCDIIVYGVS